MFKWLRRGGSDLEKALGHTFKEKALLAAALTHPSARSEQPALPDDNQRLEFLGDAVLGLLVAAYLLEKYPGRDEGFLTSLRSRATSGKMLGGLARSLNLGACLRLGKGEDASGGRARASNLEDALEALIGAAYLDGGMPAAEAVFRHAFVAGVDSLSDDVWSDNPKGKLQELAQRTWKQSPVYTLARKEGPEHAACFTTCVRLPDGAEAFGQGLSKQESESAAAAAALRALSAERLP